MKQSLILTVLMLLVVGIKAQITGTFKNFDIEKHGEIEIHIFFHSYQENEYIELKTKPDNDGIFFINNAELTNGNLCYLNIPNYLSSTVFMDQGLHIKLNAKSKHYIPSFASGKKAIFSGPDAESTIYFNKLSNIKAREYNKVKSDVTFHSKDSIHLRSHALKRAFNSHQQKTAKHIAKHPSSYATIAQDDDLADYYASQLIIHWGKPMEEQLLSKILHFSPKHTSVYTSNVFLYLHNRFFWGDGVTAQNLTRSTILALIPENQKKAFELFFTEYTNKKEGKKYDEKIYSDGLEKYINPHQSKIYSSLLSAYLDKISMHDIADLNRLLIASMPKDHDKRAIFMRQTDSMLTGEWARQIYSDTKAKDEKTINDLMNMLVDGSVPNILGHLEASNTSVQMYTADHDSLDMLLEAIKKTYPNKVIILDIWGTWCGPCRSDIKASKEKILEFKAKGIEVVYLCEGRNSPKLTWMEAVIHMKMNGTQIHMSPSLSSQFVKQFKVTGYPSHVFIDKSGNYHLDKEHFIKKLEVEEVLKKYAD